MTKESADSNISTSFLPFGQGRGLGNQLLNAIFTLAKEEGFQALCLKANRNDWALGWHRRKGFEKVGDF